MSYYGCGNNVSYSRGESCCPIEVAGKNNPCPQCYPDKQRVFVDFNIYAQSPSPEALYINKLVPNNSLYSSSAYKSLKPYPYTQIHLTEPQRFTTPMVYKNLLIDTCSC